WNTMPLPPPQNPSQVKAVRPKTALCSTLQPPPPVLVTACTVPITTSCATTTSSTPRANTPNASGVVFWLPTPPPSNRKPSICEPDAPAPSRKPTRSGPPSSVGAAQPLMIGHFSPSSFTRL